MSADLLINAIVAGILLGGFYAAVTVGISISFGILDIVNIAHPTFIIVGSYIAYIVNTHFGVDPILVAIIQHGDDRVKAFEASQIQRSHQIGAAGERQERPKVRHHPEQ